MSDAAQAVPGSGGILLVTGKVETSPTGGRAMLSRLNHDALAEKFGSRLSLIELVPRPLRGWSAIAGALRGHVDGLDGEEIACIVTPARTSGFKKVFIDGSNLGKLAVGIKRECPGVEVFAMYVFHLPLMYWLARRRTGFGWTQALKRHFGLLVLVAALVCLLGFCSVTWATAVGLFATCLAGLHGLHLLAHMTESHGVIGEIANARASIVARLGRRHD